MPAPLSHIVLDNRTARGFSIFVAVRVFLRSTDNQVILRRQSSQCRENATARKPLVIMNLDLEPEPIGWDEHHSKCFSSHLPTLGVPLTRPVSLHVGSSSF